MRAIHRILAALLAFGMMIAMAASLGGITSGNLGSDSEVVVSCDTNGVSVSYTITWNGTSDRYEVSAVSVSGISDLCDGQTLDLSLIDGANAQIGHGTLSIPSSPATSHTVNLSTPAEAKNVTAAAIVISGTAVSPSCTLNPTDDTWTNSGVGGANYGNSTEMRGGRGSVLSGSSAHRSPWVRFDISSCSIPPTATITSAALRLHESTSLYNSGARNFRADRANATWDESTITHSNMPATCGCGPSISVSNSPGAPTWRVWSVTSDVQGVVDGTYGDYGWRIFDTGSAPASGSNHGIFDPKELGSNPAELVITWDP